MLEGNTILITGSSRGIGAAIARLAVVYGAKVILHGKAESEKLARIAAELRAPYIVCDLRDAETTSAAIEPLGAIDVLVNSAGINPSKTFAELTPEDWQDIFAVNVFGLVHASKAVLPIMQKQRSGSIVNISSIKGYGSVSGKPAYAASKAAVMRITTSMAEEYAPYTIRVNSVAPGFTETEMTARTLSPKIEEQIDAIPLGRMATPEEVAEAVLFLASNRARYITGQVLAVDGGYSIAG